MPSSGFSRRPLSRIAEGAQLFIEANAKSLRRVGYTMPLIVFSNPLLGVGLFMITLLFSYLLEYGAYPQDRADKTARIQEEIILSFAEIPENKSGQTVLHIRRVSEHTRILAKALGYSDSDLENLRLASIIHDIRKPLVPSEILEKPARLTDSEFAESRKHTIYGGQLLDHVEGDVMGLAREIAFQHHERADGQGYLEGLAGEDIGMAGRIVAVADVYDALTGKRSYKAAWDGRKAYDEILKGSGTQFDAKVVDAFKAAYPEIDAVRRQCADGN